MSQTKPNLGGVQPSMACLRGLILTWEQGAVLGAEAVWAQHTPHRLPPVSILLQARHIASESIFFSLPVSRCCLCTPGGGHYRELIEF